MGIMIPVKALELEVVREIGVQGCLNGQIAWQGVLANKATMGVPRCWWPMVSV